MGRSKQGLLSAVLFSVGAVAQEAVWSEPAAVPMKPGTATGPIVVDGNRAFFTGNSGTGNELHVTDGTVAGTHRLFDLVTGPADGVRQVVAMVGGSLLFEGTTPSYPWTDYWITDGTLAGTVRRLGLPTVTKVLGPVNGRLLYVSGLQGNGQTVSIDATGQMEVLTQEVASLLAGNGVTYLNVGSSLLTTDGTAAGTQLFATSFPNAVWSQGRLWSVRSGQFPFIELVTMDPATGIVGAPLWSLVPPVPSLVPTPQGVLLLPSSLPRRLVSSDGTVAGTHVVVAGFLDPLQVHRWRDRALVIAHDPVHDVEPWISDGSTNGTYLLADLAPGPSNPWQFVATQHGTYVQTNNTTPSHLVFTDGTSGGTRTLSVAGPTQMVAMGEQVLFLEEIGNQRSQICVTDAAGTTTQPLLSPYPVGVDLRGYLEPSVNNGQIVWTCNTAIRSGGQVSSTAALANTVPASHFWTRRPMSATADDAVLIPGRTATGVDLVRWDSVSGVLSQVNLPGNVTLSYVNMVMGQGDIAYAFGDSIIITNGTDGGTLVYAPPFPWVTQAESAVALGDRVLATFGELYSLEVATGVWTPLGFSGQLLGRVGARALLREFGLQVVATDGVTTELLGITANLSGPSRLFEWQGSYWVMGAVLYATDGTAAGTRNTNGPSGVTFSSAAPAEDGIYLVGQDDVHGRELWKFDGTTYTRITDLVVGVGDGVLSVASCGNRLFLAASDGRDGLEPYVSDGTVAGTFRIADLMPGELSSMPEFVRVAGDYAYFTAQTPGQGNLMAVPLASLGVAHSERLGQGCVGRNGIPQLATSHAPRLGDGLFRYELTHGAPFAPVLFALDTTTIRQEVGPCRLRCAGGLGSVLRTTNPSGGASWNLPLPNTPQLLGLHLTAQAAVFDSLAAGPGFAVSTALGSVVGAQ